MSRCKGCGKLLVWGRTEEGKNIPLDPSAPVYRVVKHDASGQAIVKLIEKEGDERPVMVTHFKTCPMANDFSRGRKVALDGQA